MKKKYVIVSISKTDSHYGKDHSHNWIGLEVTLKEYRHRGGGWYSGNVEFVKPNEFRYACFYRVKLREVKS